jgi:hypothetical protein
MPYRGFGAVLHHTDDSGIMQNVTLLHGIDGRFSAAGKRREAQSAAIADEDTLLDGNLLPVLIISLSMWAVMITGGIWLFQHLHF